MTFELEDLRESEKHLNDVFMSRLARIDSDDTETDVVGDRIEDPGDDNG